MTKSSSLPPDVVPTPPADHERPPCTCITAPISRFFRVIVVYSPFCNGDPNHKKRAVCDADPVY